MRKRNKNVPNAPVSVGFFKNARLKSQGRRDARKYADSQDYTLTHFVQNLVSATHVSQHLVNEWLALELTSFQTANKRIEQTVSLLEADIERLERDLGPTGRIRKANSSRLAFLRSRLADELGQMDANVSHGRERIAVAQEAIETWTNFYYMQAAAYVRARVKRAKGKVASVSAKVPPIEPVAIPDWPDFFADEAEDSTRRNSK